MNRHLWALLALLPITLLLSCSPREIVIKEAMDLPLPVPDFSAGPPALVYKTRKDYRHQVPVLLSPDKSRIIGYPDPGDVAQEEGLSPYPTQLRGGYLLDNRGIGPNVAFLTLTYEEYGRLPQAPSLDEMKEMILDQDPLLELWDCGNRHQYQHLVQQLNQRIEREGLKGCRRLK